MENHREILSEALFLSGSLWAVFETDTLLKNPLAHRSFSEGGYSLHSLIIVRRIPLGNIVRRIPLGNINYSASPKNKHKFSATSKIGSVSVLNYFI